MTISILARHPGGIFRAIDLATSMPTQEIAAEALHVAMLAKVPYEVDVARFR
jgi:hypothetical protein